MKKDIYKGIQRLQENKGFLPGQGMNKTSLLIQPFTMAFSKLKRTNNFYLR